MKKRYSIMLIIVMSLIMLMSMGASVFADETDGSFSYDGDAVTFIKEDGSAFGMWAPQEGTTIVRKNGQVYISIVPKNTTTYKGMHWGKITDTDLTIDVALTDGKLNIVVDENMCGYAHPVAPVKEDGTTTGLQYYLAIPAKEKIAQQEPEKVDLAITNKTTMFKAETASLQTEGDKTYLVMALSGSGYHELFKGTYEQAVANGDGAGNDSWIHGYQNADEKWEFKIPVEDGETYMPIVTVSNSYYQKYLSGQNSLARAFYPRQATIDAEAKTLVTDDFNYEADLTVTNNVTGLAVSSAKLKCVGGPNSNGYKATLDMTMGDEAYTNAFVGTAAEAAAAEETAGLEDGVFTIEVRSMTTPGDLETITDHANGEPFTLSLKESDGEWNEYTAKLSESEKSLIIDSDNDEPGLTDGVYKLSGLEAGPSAMFNHFVANSRFLIVNGDKATVRFITDGSTASIQKYTKIALGKSSELLQENYQQELPEGTSVIEGQLQPYDEGTGRSKYLFEIEMDKANAETLFANDQAEDIYITVWNKEGSSADKIPGWYKPSNDIYLSLGTLGEKTTAPEVAEAFGFTLQVGQYIEGEDFHTASFEGVTYALKDSDNNTYAPSNETTGMLTYSNLSAAKEYTFTASKEGWAVVTQGEWDTEAHAYIYEFTGEDELRKTITKEDSGHNITGLILRKKPREETVDKALALVPEDLSLFTEDTAATVQTAVDAADPTIEDEDTLDSMAAAVISAIQGLVPKDGSYTATFEHTGNGMFKIIDVVSLDVNDGKMTLHFINGSKTYTKLYVGTVEEANAAAESDLIMPGEEATASNGKAGYNWVVPVSAFETEIPLAAYSKSKSTFNSTGNFKINAKGLRAITPEPEKVDLAITNKTTMFKAETASLQTEGDKTYLVIALSGTGYHELFKGTYEQAVANGDGSADKGNDSWIHGYQNAEGKWEFKIPVEDGETYMPLVAISNSYYQNYQEGKNSLERAFYPRQATIDAEAKTLVTDDFNYEADLTVTNNVTGLDVSSAKLKCVGGPNSNGYKATLYMTMGDEAYTNAFVGTAAEAAAAEETAGLEDGVFTIEVRSMTTPGDLNTITDHANGEPFTLSLKESNGEWNEYAVKLSENEKTLELSSHVHELTKVNSVPATCTEAGTEEYWECSCGKKFADAEGETEIDAPVAIPALGHDITVVKETVDPGFGTEGHILYECSHNCGETKTEMIPSLKAQAEDAIQAAEDAAAKAKTAEELATAKSLAEEANKKVAAAEKAAGEADQEQLAELKRANTAAQQKAAKAEEAIAKEVNDTAAKTERKAAKYTQANYKAASVKAIQAAVKALSEAKSSKDLVKIQAATKALDKAIKEAKEKKATTIKVLKKSNKKTIKAGGKKLKKKKSFTVKTKASSGAKTTYKKVGRSNKKITINSKGKVTLKKGLKKGKYTFKVKVSAKYTANAKAATKTIKITVKIK